MTSPAFQNAIVVGFLESLAATDLQGLLEHCTKQQQAHKNEADTNEWFFWFGAAMMVRSQLRRNAYSTAAKS